VKEFRYLDYTLQKNGRQEAHVRDRVAKAAAILEQVWKDREEIWEGLEKEDMDV